MIESNKIYNEDCLEGMKRIPDKSVDMILADLPYGTTRKSQHRSKKAIIHISPKTTDYRHNL